MSKHKSSVVRAAGFLATFNHRLFSGVETAGIPDERFYELLKGEDADFMAKIIRVFAESAGTVVGTLADMVAACDFRHVNSNINEQHFPLVGSTAAVSDMLTVSQKDLGGINMTTAEIESAIDRKGYLRATLAEQLVYAKAMWNGRDTVVALGSSWVDPRGFRHVPYLCEDVGGRKLVLDWGSPELRWDEDCLFLVVRKSST